MQHRTVAFVILSWLLVQGGAQARSGVTFAYPFDDVYSTAVRFVRIDRGCTITDRDAKSAYLMFDCKDGKVVKHGAMEVYHASEGVRVQLTLSDEPEYIELRFLDLLGRKLRDERGEPPPAPAPPPAKDSKPKEDSAG